MSDYPRPPSQGPSGGDQGPHGTPPPYQGSYGHPPSFAPGLGPTPGPGGYSRQQLLPQQIRKGTNRTPIYIAVAVVLALLVSGGVAVFLLRDKGEDNRAEYCAELRDLTDDGDLSSALSGADQSTFDRLLQIKDIAPSSVADDWTTVTDVLQGAMDTGTPDLGEALEAYSALKVIARDAESNCDLTLDGIPGI